VNIFAGIYPEIVIGPNNCPALRANAFEPTEVIEDESILIFVNP
jgi:hypothetical protein